MFMYAWLCWVSGSLWSKSGSVRGERNIGGEQSSQRGISLGLSQARRHRTDRTVTMETEKGHGEEKVGREHGLTCNHPDAIRRLREVEER